MGKNDGVNLRQPVDLYRQAFRKPFCAHERQWGRCRAEHGIEQNIFPRYFQQESGMAEPGNSGEGIRAANNVCRVDFEHRDWAFRRQVWHTKGVVFQQRNDGRPVHCHGGRYFIHEQAIFVVTRAGIP